MKMIILNWMATGAALLFLAASLQAQPAYAQELWKVYDNAPNFPAKKEAFRKLEKFYANYDLDSNLLLCDTFKKIALKFQPDYAPFVDIKKASTLTRKLEFEKAAAILLPILENAEKTGIDSLRASALLTLANLNNAQKNKDLALERAKEAAAIHQRLQNWRDLCADYLALSNFFVDKNADSSLYYLQRTQAIGDEHHLEEVKAAVANNFGTYYHRRKEYEKAIECYKSAVLIHQKLDNRFNLCFALLNIGHAYRKLQQWPQAKPWFDQALPVCASCGNTEGAASVHLGLADMYKQMGDYKQALEEQIQLNDVNGTLQEQRYSRATQALEAKYGAEKKERELLEERAKNYRQAVWLYSLLALFGATLLLGYLFWNRYRLQKKAELDAAVIREQQAGLNAVIETQEAERKRIARDLHDGIAQELVAIKLGFHVLQVNMPNSGGDKIAELAQQLDASCLEIRQIAHGMAPPMLEQKGLAPSLEFLLRTTLHPAGIHSELEVQGIPERLDEKVTTGLYRIAQELLANIVKHAGATTVSLQLYKAGDNLVMKMEDNGKGYDFEKARQKGNMGLLNILTRVRALNGVFFADPAIPHGTVATVRISL